MSSVYQLTLSNGQFYIGQTHNSIKQRLQTHRSKAKAGEGCLLYETMRLIGIQNNSIKVLVEGAYTTAQLNDLERFLITKLKPELNTREGGASSGKYYTPVTKEEVRNHLISLLKK